ncbi:Ferredoxin-fold anticodon-binding domain-containing protein 1 [Camelus dromedarius]|uniref:Mannosyltransferase n=3 Tax=Camelus dromedarius TaxID=9838 RepID=A0A5N4C7Q0_CAMDR|nr:Ferredoxin-fold anticodon-binding domain-containing protein 1 [Camelus dromedarius]
MAPRRLLLVGEGNFSFAAALSETLDPSTRLTATCLQRPADLAGSRLVRENLQRLRERGTEVRFGVDCTQLADAFELHDREFDRIYFNFPHCGRKAGVAKNRELLAKFFQSCADVLAEEGEVHVALCRGQGGTPADKPMREWHNSWQVVAMAALGGFILSDVHPFSCEAVSGYKCTGYRSQDKSFHVDGALNHVFTRSLPFEGLQPRISRIKLGDQWFSFLEPEVLVGKLNRGFLEAPSCHPVKTINEKLIGELGKAFPLKRLKCSSPLLPQGGTSVLTSCNYDILSAAFWISLCEDNSNAESLTGGTTQDMEDFLVSFSELSLPKSLTDSTEEAHNGISGQAKVCLRPSLLVHVQAVIQAPDFLSGSVHILSGPVFQKCCISPFTMPAFHETLFILGFNKNLKDGCLRSLLDHLKCILDSLLSQTLLEGSKRSSSVEFVFQPNRKDYVINVKSHSFGPDCVKDLTIGSVTTSATSAIHKDQCFVCVSVNLDLLAMLVWGISDWRMLWTFDTRFLKNFVPGKIEPFKSYSLHPPHYVHDISFWIDEKKRFDEVEFHTVARAVSQDTVISIRFLSRFQHPKTEQVSLCYRLTYQTCDKALTQQQILGLSVVSISKGYWEIGLIQDIEEWGALRLSGNKAGQVWAPEGSTAFKCLLSARLCAALLSNVSDCDETFNYWEPTHYLIYGKGFQTWEYSPAYAIRSYAYLLLHAWPAAFHARILQTNKILVFYFLRCLLAFVSCICELYFYKAVCKKFGLHVSRMMLAFLVLSTGMFCSSSAFLPSSFCMYTTLIAMTGWYMDKTSIAVLGVAAGAILGWPFSAALGLPIAFDVLVMKHGWKNFINWSLVALMLFLVPVVVIDSYYYGKLVIAPLNIVLYNVFTSHGPDLYGTEPWYFYLINGFLNFNVVFALALLVLPLTSLMEYLLQRFHVQNLGHPYWLTLAPMYIWFIIFFIQPHKEERFLFPVYPLICLCGAVALSALQKCYHFVFQRYRLEHYTVTSNWLALGTLFLFGLLSFSRSVALFRGYHGPLDLYPEFYRIATDPTIHTVPEGRPVNVCVGKEWYRFPSSFLLPDNWQLQFIPSEFRGQLPKPFAEGPLATRIVPTDMNDQNLEEPSRYVRAIFSLFTTLKRVLPLKSVGIHITALMRWAFFRK